MKTILIIALSLPACTVLTACGGSPMQVESRTASPGAERELTMEDRLLMHQRRMNSRGAY